MVPSEPVPSSRTAKALWLFHIPRFENILCFVLWQIQEILTVTNTRVPGCLSIVFKQFIDFDSDKHLKAKRDLGSSISSSDLTSMKEWTLSLETSLQIKFSSLSLFAHVTFKSIVSIRIEFWVAQLFFRLKSSVSIYWYLFTVYCIQAVLVSISSGWLVTLVCPATTRLASDLIHIPRFVQVVRESRQSHHLRGVREKSHRWTTSLIRSVFVCFSFSLRRSVWLENGQHKAWTPKNEVQDKLYFRVS